MQILFLMHCLEVRIIASLPVILTVRDSASTAKHFPTTTIGMLEVFLPESYFIQQRYTVYDGSRMYIRGNYGGTWSSWHTVSLTTVT